MILNEGTLFDKGESETIVATDNEALALLLPNLYPITTALNKATAIQADEIIRAERDEIVDRYNEEKNEFIDKELWEDKQYLTALRGVHHRTFEGLTLRSDLSRFVKDDIITDRTRHALFTYRPNYDLAEDKEPSFTYDLSLAPDLEVFYRGLKRHQLKDLGDIALTEFNDTYFPEDNWEYLRTTEAINGLEQLRGDVELPSVPMPTQPKDVTTLNYVRNWRDALFVR